MKKVMYLMVFAVLLGFTMCQKEPAVKPAVKNNALKSDDVTKLLINNSTIYKVEKSAIWTTTLNQLQIITRFGVTPTTLIYLNGKPTTLDQLKPGFKVTIYYFSNPACASSSIFGCNTAVRILAYSKTPIVL